MAIVNYAAIDIGSNAARLLIKSVDTNATEENRFKKLLLLRVPLRLGFDVFTMGELSEKKSDRLRRLMKVYSQLMKIYEVDKYRACATSAMRDARNGADIIGKIEKSTDIKIEIIGGKEEAQIIYNNHADCIEGTKGNFMFVDVGGGSTEVNLLKEGELIFSSSYNIGTVRILSNAVKSGAWEQLESELSEATKGIDNINIIGSGGNINKLCRMIIGKESKVQKFSIDSLKDVYEELKPLTPDQRMQKYGMKQDRADVIVPAAEIFLLIAKTIGAKGIHVPILGLSDGIIEKLYKESI